MCVRVNECRKMTKWEFMTFRLRKMSSEKKTLCLPINTNIEAYILVLQSYKFMKDTQMEYYQ